MRSIEPLWDAPENVASWALGVDAIAVFSDAVDDLADRLDDEHRLLRRQIVIARPAGIALSGDA